MLLSAVLRLGALMRRNPWLYGCDNGHYKSSYKLHVRFMAVVSVVTASGSLGSAFRFYARGTRNSARRGLSVRRHTLYY